MVHKTLLLLIASVALQALAAEKLPPDVRAFVRDREGCDHMRGEIPDPPDARRMREINREIRKLCKGTDQRLAGLKRKYAEDPAVLERLNEFEPRIEASTPAKRTP